jgi:hypothetical protein
LGVDTAAVATSVLQNASPILWSDGWAQFVEWVSDVLLKDWSDVTRDDVKAYKNRDKKAAPRFSASKFETMLKGRLTKAEIAELTAIRDMIDAKLG